MNKIRRGDLPATIPPMVFAGTNSKPLESNVAPSGQPPAQATTNLRGHDGKKATGTP